MPKKPTNSPSFSVLLAQRNELLSHIVEALDNCDGEQEAIAQEVLDEIILPAIANKIDGLAYVIQHSLPTQIAELKAFQEQVASKRKSLEGALSGLKERLKILHSTGAIADTIQGDVSQINISTGAYSVDDTECQPAEWGSEWNDYRTITISYKIDKKRILEDHKAGRPLPPGIVVKNGSRLSIKIKE